MKGNTAARRLAAVCCVMLSAAAFPVRGISFLHRSSVIAGGPNTAPSRLEASRHESSSSSTSSSSSSSSHSDHPRRRSLWNVFSPRSSSLKARASPNITATEEASPQTTFSGIFPSLASLTTFATSSNGASTHNGNTLHDDTAIIDSSAAASSSSTTVTPERPPSVHLRLRTEEENEVEQKPPKPKPSKSNLKIHTYVDARGRIWKALNTPKDKFEAFLQYNDISPAPNRITTHETSTQVDAATAAGRRKEWRNLWKKGQLLTERTEYLAVYPSDDRDQRKKNGIHKRGGFSDLLYLYTQRLLSFLRDEKEDKKSIFRWLQKEYGRAETNRLKAAELNKYPPSEQMAYLKEFLEWFRTQFPYYYDRCGNCGASIREDVANNQISDNAIDGADRGHKTFLGYVYPLGTELRGKASRTELYKCHKCNAFTRFPRFNSAWHVIEHKRGRCGEYSMLLYRILRALDHEARWVVDWADHVWVEVHLERSGKWVHLDPCEAAVHENYLYQGWGKKQTYVLGFYAPRVLPSSSTNGLDSNAKNSVSDTPLIEDITASYTTDTWDEIQARREESEGDIKIALEQTTEQLRQRLAAGLFDE